MRTLTMRELMCAPVDEFAGLPPVDSDADPLKLIQRASWCISGKQYYDGPPS